MQGLSLGASKAGPPLISLAGLWAPGVHWQSHAPARPLFSEHFRKWLLGSPPVPRLQQWCSFLDVGADSLWNILAPVLRQLFPIQYILNCGLVSFSVRSSAHHLHLIEILPRDSTQIASFLTFTFVFHFSFIITEAILWLLQWIFGNGTVTP